MTKEEIIDTIGKMMDHGMDQYLKAKSNYNTVDTLYWDGYTEALESLDKEIRGGNL